MVQKCVESCVVCVTNGKPERPPPMQRVFAPKVVWESIAVDFNGPYALLGGISILVVIDYRSRFLFARPVKSTSYECTKRVLEEIFEIEGYPKSIRSDNGPPFNGSDYKNYCASRGIKAVFSTPMYPQQNGLVENSMKIVNKAMSAAISNKTNYADELREAVHAYNSAAHSITRLPPEEVMQGRKIRRGLPLVNPGKTVVDDAMLDERDRKAKLEGKHREDSRRGARSCRVQPGDTVIIQRQFRSKGQPRFSPTRYTVADENNGSLVLHSEDGQSLRRHVTQTKKVSHCQNKSKSDEVQNPGVADDNEPNMTTSSAPTAAEDHTNRRSRVKRAPAYLDQYVRSVEQ